jgi:endonuclease I
MQFTLVVDDFGIKYIGQEHPEHLLNALKEHYEVSVDYNGELYCGITLEWNYDKCYVDISMPGYVEKQLLKYKHPRPAKPVNTQWEPTPF